MLVVISPAKSLDMTPARGIEATRPAYGKAARELAGIARGLGVDDLRRLMKISENLARINAERFAKFGRMPAKPAALAFAGDTYQGLEAASLDLEYAQDHLRILSGLYGLLRPRDAIQPYRLEMGSRLGNPQGKTLYAYWGDRIARALNRQARKTGAACLVNCASQEYFCAVDPAALKLPVVTPQFMELKEGRPQMISFFAKRARGAMARFVVQNRLTTPAELLAFDTGGYEHCPEMSEEGMPVFLRQAG